MRLPFCQVTDKFRSLILMSMLLRFVVAEFWGCEPPLEPLPGQPLEPLTHHPPHLKRQRQDRPHQPLQSQQVKL